MLFCTFPFMQVFSENLITLYKCTRDKVISFICHGMSVILSALKAMCQLELNAEVGNFKALYFYLAEGWMSHHGI